MEICFELFRRNSALSRQHVSVTLGAAALPALLPWIFQAVVVGGNDKSHGDGEEAGGNTFVAKLPTPSVWFVSGPLVLQQLPSLVLPSLQLSTVPFGTQVCGTTADRREPECGDANTGTDGVVLSSIVYPVVGWRTGLEIPRFDRSWLSRPVPYPPESEQPLLVFPGVFVPVTP